MCMTAPFFCLFCQSSEATQWMISLVPTGRGLFAQVRAILKYEQCASGVEPVVA